MEEPRGPAHAPPGPPVPAAASPEWRVWAGGRPGGESGSGGLPAWLPTTLGRPAGQTGALAAPLPQVGTAEGRPRGHLRRHFAQGPVPGAWPRVSGRCYLTWHSDAHTRRAPESGSRRRGIMASHSESDADTPRGDEPSLLPASPFRPERTPRARVIPEFPHVKSGGGGR